MKITRARQAWFAVVVAYAVYSKTVLLCSSIMLQVFVVATGIRGAESCVNAVGAERRTYVVVEAPIGIVNQQSSLN